MDYEEACDATVTKAEALAEIKRHSCDAAEFLAECGDRSEYKGGVVLAWLGY